MPTPSLTQRYAYNASNDIEFSGEAAAGSLESSNVWSIAKFFYNSNGDVISKKFANGTDKFHVAWSSRESLEYA